MGRLSTAPRARAQEAGPTGNGKAPERVAGDGAGDHELLSVSRYGPLIVERYRKPDGRRLTLYTRAPTD